MQLFSSSRPSCWGGRWLLGLLLLGLSWLLPGVAHATHLRAGDIQAKVDTTPTHNPNRIFFRVTMYRDPRNAPLNNLNVFYGDGSSSLLEGPNGGGIPKSSEVVVVPNLISVVTFNFDHTYAGSSTYKISVVEVNRIGGVVNMTQSINQSFYIESTITVDPGIGLNHLPVLRGPAIDRAAIGIPFLHSPAAYDADGDSLGYELLPCRQVIGGVPTPVPTNYTPNPTTCVGFVEPNDPSIRNGTSPPLTVAYPGTSDSPSSPGGQPAVFVQNPRTGLITWNAPALAGVYNIAYIVREYRRFTVGGVTGYSMIGSVVRDMQIIVVATTNLPPTVSIPADTCVVAGAQLLKRVTAGDNSTATSEPATAVKLFAYSGVIPPATFTQTVTNTTRSVGVFNWTPQCENVASDPYIIAFKAQDSPTGNAETDPPLVDIKTWRVTVVGPAPTSLKAAVGTDSRVLLTWERYYCQNSSVAAVKPTVLIFRRENCYAFTPSACQTGLPAGSGYVQIGSVPADVFSFIDDNGGNGLVRGRTYSYRIYVTFPRPAGGASLASTEACVTLSGRSARLTNVDVLSTATATGQVAIKWTQPKPNVGSFNAPLGYRLSRSTTGAAPFTLVTTKTALNDTTYVDNNLDTQTNQYTYQLVFFSAATTQPGSAETSETSPLASSVRLAVVPNSLGSSNALTWSYNVPWDNSTKPTVIYRRTNTGTYAQIATVTPSATSGTYVDQDPTLQRGQTYCYYVQTAGQYSGVTYLNNLLNKSQERCVVLNATPCTPVLTLAPTNCDSLAALSLASTFPLQNQRYQNRLRWTLSNTPTGCSSEAAYYRIFYRSTADGALALLDSTTQTTYLHRMLPNGAGCYAVQAVNAAGVRSAISNVACQDNCVFFTLPNIFTPNGDDINERFRPKTASPVTRTHIQIFNRWGRKVYESDKDPYINWDGGGAAGETGTSGKVADGIYYYLAEVQFADFAGTTRTFKGWVEIVR